jgi:chromate transporter
MVTVPTLKQLASTYFRIGNTTFGGGDPTIAVLAREFDRRGWLAPEQFTVAYGLARITPGTNMLAFCAGAAWLMRGLAGAVAALAAVTIPSAILVVWLTRICEASGGNRWAHAAIAGTLAAAVGSMLAAALALARVHLTNRNWLSTTLVIATAFALAQFLNLSPISILGLAAVAGLFRTRP